MPGSYTTSPGDGVALPASGQLLAILSTNMHSNLEKIVTTGLLNSETEKIKGQPNIGPLLDAYMVWEKTEKLPTTPLSLA